MVLFFEQLTIVSQVSLDLILFLNSDESLYDEFG